MPGATGTPQPPGDNGEDDREGDDIDVAENVPLFLPSSLDPERRKRVSLQQVAEHE